MGYSKYRRPKHMAKKLAAIREYLGFSQEEMIKYLRPETTDTRAARSMITEFEKDRRVPPPEDLLMYAKAVREHTPYKSYNMEYIVDDTKPLPWLLH